MPIPQQTIESEAVRFTRLSQELHQKLRALKDRDGAYQRFIRLNEHLERELRSVS